jgi:hypothetical protein
VTLVHISNVRLLKVKRVEFVSYSAVKSTNRSLLYFHVFDEFPKYHMTILLGGFSAKIGREDIFRPTVGVRVYTKLVLIMELGSKLCHIQKSDCQTYNISTF